MAHEHHAPAAGNQPASSPPPTAAEDENEDASVEWGVRSRGPLTSDHVRLHDGGRADAVADLEHRQRMWPTESHHLMCRRVSPWQRVGPPLPDLVAPPAGPVERPSLVCLDEAEAADDPAALSPDCSASKCGACVGEAWDERVDQPTRCACVCHAREPS